MSPSPRLQSFKDRSCVGSSPQVTVPVRSLLPCGFSGTEAFFRAYPLAQEWSFPQAAGKYLKAPGAPPPSPSSLTLVSAGLFLTLPPHTHILLNSNLSFLKCVFTKVPPTLLVGFILTNGGSIGELSGTSCAWSLLTEVTPVVPCYQNLAT